MGNRLSKIYTRTGDSGTTGLADGRRVDKDSLRIEAIGSIDELNSQIGAILAHETDEGIRRCLMAVQNDLFDLGGELCLPDYQAISDADIDRLEHWLDGYNAELPPLKEFILPGGGPRAASCHVARTVCRRAERRIITLRREEPVADATLAYLNRLSDLLFVLARTLCRQELGQEVLWQSKQKI